MNSLEGFKDLLREILSPRKETDHEEVRGERNLSGSPINYHAEESQTEELGREIDALQLANGSISDPTSQRYVTNFPMLA